MIYLAIKLAIIAFVYTDILTAPDMLLAPLKLRLTILAEQKPWTEWFLKPLMLCTYCVAGQLALWVLILQGGFGIWQVGTVVNALFVICLTILLSHYLIKLKECLN